MKAVIDTLRTMAHNARDSAALHAAHGDRFEAERWEALAQQWEERVAAMQETREDRASYIRDADSAIVTLGYA